ncbi:MAG: S1 RNA-binding domain-containing protein, partial [Phycisphaerae bacterium]|nr:S1 RNA-binding domain-containing protein [Phycisphaerae bacterium]
KEVEAALGDMDMNDLVDVEAGKQPKAKARGKGKRKRPAQTEKVIQGKVISIDGDSIFLDIGGRNDGLLPSEQFSDEPLPEVGDSVDVTIEGVDESEGLVILSRKGAVLAATWDSLHRGQAVEARVTGKNKGGLECSINGIRAFMPASQVEIRRVEDLQPYVGQTLQAKVSEIDFANENVVISRRDLIEQEQAAAREHLWETIQEGQVVKGVVRNIMPYGAFVDIGGEDGLVHVSDLSHGHVDKPEDILQPGQEVEVKILSVDREEKKISLGVKQTMADPWDTIEQKYPVDELVSGRITRLVDFGAFVELEEGVEGLVPIGEISFGRRIGHPKEVLAEGEMVKVRVIRVEPKRNRISLSIKRVGDDPWTGASARWPVGSKAKGVVTRVAEFGAFVELVAGVEGLIHISELADRHVKSVEEVVKEGDTVEARILDVDEDKRRIGLSLKTSANVEAGTSAAEYNTRQGSDDRNRKKPLKGGLDADSIETPFGELRLG